MIIQSYGSMVPVPGTVSDTRSIKLIILYIFSPFVLVCSGQRSSARDAFRNPRTRRPHAHVARGATSRRIYAASEQSDHELLGRSCSTSWVRATSRQMACHDSSQPVPTRMPEDVQPAQACSYRWRDAESSPPGNVFGPCYARWLYICATVANVPALVSKHWSSVAESLS